MSTRTRRTGFFTAPRGSGAEPTRLERLTDSEAGEITPIPRLERYRFHSRALPEPAQRDVLVYLPPHYEREPGRAFPVFYLQDGQNLFDGKTSYVPGQTWQAHTTADRLSEAGEIEPVILVGIANAGFRRMSEYTPSRNLRLGGGEGRSYGRLIADELKPLVDGYYRTLRSPVDTGVGGSSLGGLVSLFLGFERPEVFGKIAALSPSLWWDQRDILTRIHRVLPRPQLRIWMDMGSNEGSLHVRDVRMLYRQLVRQGWREGVDIEYFLADGGEHNESAWAARFDRVLRFLFARQTLSPRD